MIAATQSPILAYRHVSYLLSALSSDDSSALPLDYLTDEELRAVALRTGRATSSREEAERAVSDYLSSVGR